MALSFRPFCPCGSRRVSLWYLSAGLRYTTPPQDGPCLPIACWHRGAAHDASCWRLDADEVITIYDILRLP